MNYQNLQITEEETCNNNQEYQEIINLISPKFEKIKQKEKQLENLAKRANEYVHGYQRNNELLEKEIEKYKNKKGGLKKFAEDLSNLRNDLKLRESKILEKENYIKDVLKNENQKLEINREKFEIYVENKSNELLLRAQEIKNKSRDLAGIQKLLDQKSVDLSEKSELISKSEKELKLQFSKLEKEKYDFEIRKKEFELGKEEFELYSGEIIKKYQDMKKIQEEVEKGKSVLSNLELEIKSKTEEAGKIAETNQLLRAELLKKHQELEVKLKNVEAKEAEINSQKLDLEGKLAEITDKLESTRKLTKELKDKENLLKIKQGIDKELDLKLSELEINEALYNKKVAVQEKLFNERVNEEINKKIAGFNMSRSNYTSNSSRFYK